MRQTWVSTPNKLDTFAKDCFQGSLQKISNLCNFVHSYLSIMLADRLYEISVSLTEIVDRLNTNLRKHNEYCADKINDLIQNLYEKNKEHLEIYRRVNKRSVDSAEVSKTIEDLRQKMKQTGNEETIARLELETRCKDLPGTKTMCFDLIGENLRDRIAYLDRKELVVARTLITFFCVRDARGNSSLNVFQLIVMKYYQSPKVQNNSSRFCVVLVLIIIIIGTDRDLYTDSVGSYYCDEFYHQNYITNYGLKYFHVNCDGDFVENVETEPYYFDENGRYVIRDGEKFHQCAPCTSLYKLTEDGFFQKVTKDCGHSERVNPNCRMEIKDLTDAVILPKNDFVDITGKLDSDSVKFLWDSFGMILPEVLYAVATHQPKNPIHYMAHILIKRRFEATKQEFRKLTKKADKYRTKLHEERIQKTKAERLVWKSKLTKYAKPEDLDDTHQQAMSMQNVSDWMFLNFLQNY
ncbi:hypothetical protein HF086_008013 [Spodoptera exigua]|uniref:Uncharacterized protein n=1 Tax=Spodoptera exigua TaxID=7107 RepID=A0A922M4J9_SPOEX|nr:hypothetical protein HF086_008013 [Spodoptera exigua]